MEPADDAERVLVSDVKPLSSSVFRTDAALADPGSVALASDALAPDERPDTPDVLATDDAGLVAAWLAADCATAS
jgi:hypothetical protein